MVCAEMCLVKILIFYCICSTLYLPTNARRDSTHYSQEFLKSRKEILDTSTDTVLEWKVDPKRTPNSIISFTFSTHARDDDGASGMILFGLSKRGEVYGSDVAAVRISGDGEAIDMYGVDNDTIVPDKRQDWRLHSVNMNESHVSFTISRFLDTCDSQDVAIKKDLLHIIWGFTHANVSEEISRFRVIPKGTFPIHLLDPTVTNPKDIPGSETFPWRISHKIHMPPRRTTYSCTMHRGPLLSKKHHVVSFAPYFKDEVSKEHVHHMFVHRCVHRPGLGSKDIFKKFVDHPWEDCNLVWKHELPTTYCIEILVGWAVGGELFLLPSDVGFAVGDEQNEYFLLEAHLNNPDSRSDLVVEVGMEMMLSPQLRQHDGSIVAVGFGVFGLFQLPPRTKSFRVAGHCSSGCTTQMLPTSSAEVVAVAHHTHLTGQKIIQRHFRGTKELDWISSDLNYDSGLQHPRLLSNRVTIYPGDHLTTECMYDTSLRNGSSVAGYATADEMCVAFLILNKQLPYAYCMSEYPTYRTMARYGIREMIFDLESSNRIVTAAANKSFIGLSLQHVMDWVDGTSWSEEKVISLEREQMLEWHDGACIHVRRRSTLGHVLDIIDEASIGLLPTGVVVDKYRINPETLSSSFFPGLRSVRYPFVSHIYRPPQTCQGKSL